MRRAPNSLAQSGKRLVIQWLSSGREAVRCLRKIEATTPALRTEPAGARRFRLRGPWPIGNTADCRQSQAPLLAADGCGGAHDGDRFCSVRRRARHRFGRDHPAVLPHRARRREQEPLRRLRSGDRRRPRRGSRHARADQANISRARHPRRGIRRRARPTPNMSGCSIRSTAPNPSSAACRPGAR